ncbi:hypothetical protein [Actinobacillus minor]|uniref:hypothetical protein n=1 Tax=Actinobacillus minor TaxID=51047 RepID=UPI0023F4FD22|nr:hypothetical protein [Actinobacillus minor]MDD6910243.1 hypothetical protein [Actinobacillus minor]MDY4712882.1 hypothetical protein [Actinobacillus minor]
MLKTFNNNNKEQYIRENLGENVLKKAQKIHQGGGSAAKGQKYEDLFTLFKVIEVASNPSNNWAEHRFSRQNLDFFDDVCYEDFATNTKHNYQAKNSALSAADWNKEHEQRVQWQVQVDSAFHKVNSSQNYIVVPSEEKQKSNMAKIPAELKPYCKSIYFPYYPNQFHEFVEKQLSEMLAVLIHSEESSDHEYAANLLLGILTNNDQPRTLEEIFNSARSEGYPNPFEKTDKALPIWLKDLLEKNHQFTYQVKGAYLVVKFKQLELRMPMSEIININAQDSEKIIDTPSLIKYLMDISAKSLMENA